MKEKIKEIIATLFGLKPSEISDNISQANTEIWDSMMHVNLILNLENEFDVMFEPEEIVSMSSLDDLMETITKHKNPNN